MRLELLQSEFVIARLSADAPVPGWASGEFVSITRTADELSIVCEASALAEGHRGFRCLEVEGPLDFSLVGVLSQIAGALSRAEVPIFVVSTFDTDHILVSETHLARAITALEADGHLVRR